jgi:acetyl esterase/lipase
LRKKIMSDKNPYTLALASQLAEIPLQLAHHLRASRPLARPEKHCFGSGWRQYLLMWLPPEEIPQKNSVIMLYHGGGWRVGWPGLHPTIAEFFLREGFPVVMPAYRLVPFASHKQMREDLNLALDLTLNLLKEKNLEEKKLLAGGMSAGATLAAHLVFDKAALEKSGIGQELFSGFLSFAGPLDIDKMPDFRALRQYAGGQPGSAAFGAANPVQHLSGDEKIPALLMHGTTDAIVPFACSQSFFEKYAGQKMMHPLPGKSHLDSIRFATDDTAAATVLRKWLADK